MKIRFKRVASKRRAALQIMYGHGGGPSGRATLGYRRRSTSSADLGTASATAAPSAAAGGSRKGGRLRKRALPLRRPRLARPRGAKELADPYRRNYMRVAAAHELGHVLGLRH